MPVVLAETDDVVHPLLFACETKNPAIVKIGLTSLQKLIQYKAIPQASPTRNSLRDTFVGSISDNWCQYH